jgi:hypothetical protein
MLASGTGMGKKPVSKTVTLDFSGGSKSPFGQTVEERLKNG